MLLKTDLIQGSLCSIVQWYSCADVGRLHPRDDFRPKQAGSRFRQVSVRWCDNCSNSSLLSTWLKAVFSCFILIVVGFRLMVIQQCDLILVHIHPQGEDTLVSDRPKKEVGAHKEDTRLCESIAMDPNPNPSFHSCWFSLHLPLWLSQISPLLTSEVHCVRAGRHLSTKLNILVQQNFDLASTTITNIPMKVRGFLPFVWSCTYHAKITSHINFKYLISFASTQMLSCPECRLLPFFFLLDCFICLGLLFSHSLPTTSFACLIFMFEPFLTNNYSWNFTVPSFCLSHLHVDLTVNLLLVSCCIFCFASPH